ncbi:MAG: TIGR03960 family B12-binding radical SAM protein [Planctomycetota bacterium]|jgi:radical SAM family uncharacterized protein
MRNLRETISRRLLPAVAQPGQYIGLETNACCGDVTAADVTVAMAFPDTYSVGISHLGSQVLYHMLNGIDGVACDRTYCPLPDAEEVMRREDIPLFGWESRCAIADFDVVGVSVPYEMDVINVLTMLDLAGIPLRAAERKADDAIIVGGDCLADSPEPLADFVDIFLVGDGEQPLTALVEIVRELKSSGATRDDIILAAAQRISSAYVPRFYEPHYDSDGRFAGLKRLRNDVPETVEHAHVADLSDSPAITAPLVPVSEGVHERVVVEVMRGCPNNCRFCQAGQTRLPVRARPVDEIIESVRKALAATGYREVSLLSLSTSDYPHLDELIDRLSAELTPQHVSISLPSLRVDSQLKQLPKLTSTVRKGGLTIAAEAGSQRLRKAINKRITEEDMLAGVRAAYEAGWRRVKVYFMAGLPGETDDDLDAIVDLCRRLSDTRRDIDGHPGAISASVSWAVPKPHTPMQWCAMQDEDYFWSVRRRLKSLARRTQVHFKFHRIERSLLEAVICRGDRRVGPAIEAAYRNGARLDGWDEHFNYDAWQAAFAETNIDPAAYRTAIPTDAPTPWSHISCRRSGDTVRSEYDRMMADLEA